MTRKDYILIAEVLRVEFHNAKLHMGPMANHVLSVAASLADSIPITSWPWFVARKPYSLGHRPRRCNRDASQDHPG